MQWLRTKWTALGALACFAAAGCGGSGSSSGGAQEQTVEFGRASTRLVGTAQTPVVASSLGSVVTGTAGATITSLTLTFPNVLSETRIAYSVTDSVSPGIYLIPPFGGDPYRALPNQIGYSEPTWSRDGTVLVSDGNVREASPRQTDVNNLTSISLAPDSTFFSTHISNITEAFPDGSVRSVTTTGKDLNPAWWPASRICFESWRDGNAEIYVMNSDGTLQTNLTKNAAADTAPCWSPDGTWIAYVSNRNGPWQVMRMLADGTSNTILIGETTFDCWDPQYSPDGSRIAYVTNKDGNSEIYVSDAFGGNRTRITTNTTSDFDPSWSPDGNFLTYTHVNAAGYPEVWTASAAGNNLKQISLAAHAARPYWSPFVTSRSLIGPSRAMFGTSASGFLYGQRGDINTSIVIFDTATPSGARVSALTAAGSSTPNFVFEVTSTDTIRSLQFTNDFYQLPTVAVAPPPAQDLPPPQPNGALVTFNSTTGKVSSILPYVANRSAAPVQNQKVNLLTVHRQFTAVVDAAGRNLAPNGASQVRIDTATGRVSLP
jgi:dipeptidyl aminopeptidase/acylaminoacyl peptidase